MVLMFHSQQEVVSNDLRSLFGFRGRIVRKRLSHVFRAENRIIRPRFCRDRQVFGLVQVADFQS